MSGIVQGLIASLKSAAASATDAFFNRVTLLLNTSSTNGAQNNTFLDSSSNNFSITRNGNTTQGTFTPFSQTGWSTFFNGSNQKIASVAGTNFAYGTGAFTVEAFIYLTSYTTPYGSIILSQAVSGTNYFIFQVTTTGQIEFNYATSGGGTYVTSTTTIPLNTWAHVAAVRQGTGTNQFALYINGTNAATSTVAQDFSNTTYTPTIGDYTHTTLLPFAGYISNLRVIKGQALATGNFTSPTSALSASTVGWTGANAATSITGTVSLLTMQSNRFVDNGAGNTTLTLTGTPSVQAFSPFAPTAAYDAAVVGGSGYFDGTGDYLSVGSAGQSQFNLGSPSGSTNNFTLECWFYPTAALSASTYSALMGCHDGVDTSSYAVFARSNGVFIYGSGNTFTGGGTVNANTWYHVAIVRSDSVVTVYLNGVQVDSQTRAGNYNNTSDVFQIADDNTAANIPFTGYISNLRVIKGTAVYSGTSTTTPNFTLPTAPFTATMSANPFGGSNTSAATATLLTNFTNAGIYDAAAKNVLETVGNAQVSTTQAKFGTTSIAFDGSGDYLSAPSSQTIAFGTGPYTIEMWFYKNDVASLQGLVCGGNFRFFQNTVGFWFLNSGTSIINAGSSLVSTGQWYHVALVREGTGTNQTKLYLNGSLVTSGTGTDATNWPATTFTIGSEAAGSYLNGYIDDLRISKYARYTANFTAPTSAFALQ
jgi:hypothetical protein